MALAAENKFIPFGGDQSNFTGSSQMSASESEVKAPSTEPLSVLITTPALRRENTPSKKSTSFAKLVPSTSSNNEAGTPSPISPGLLVSSSISIAKIQGLNEERPAQTAALLNSAPNLKENAAISINVDDKDDVEYGGNGFKDGYDKVADKNKEKLGPDKSTGNMSHKSAGSTSHKSHGSTHSEKGDRMNELFVMPFIRGYSRYLESRPGRLVALLLNKAANKIAFWSFISLANITAILLIFHWASRTPRNQMSLNIYIQKP